MSRISHYFDPVRRAVGEAIRDGAKRRPISHGDAERIDRAIDQACASVTADPDLQGWERKSITAHVGCALSMVTERTDFERDEDYVHLMHQGGLPVHDFES